MPLYPDFPAALSEIRALYAAEKHLAAGRKLASLRAHLTSSPPSLPHSAALSELETPLFCRIADECAEVERLRAAMQVRDDWTLSYNGPDTKVWYRREAHTASHSVLTEGTIRAPLLHVAALIYEADLYPSLFWYVLHAQKLAVRDAGGARMKRGAHIVAYAPWPLYRREAAVYAYGVDALDEEEGCVMVVSRSARQEDGLDLDAMEAMSRAVRIDMHASGFELVPSAPGVVKARFLYNVDPHLSFVPMALINWAARTLCRWSLRTLESRARDLSEMPAAYEERIATEPFYEFVRTRQDEFWKHKGFSPETFQSEEIQATTATRTSDNFDANVVPAGPPASVLRSVVSGQRRTQRQQEQKPRSSLSRFFFSTLFL